VGDGIPNNNKYDCWQVTFAPLRSLAVEQLYSSASDREKTNKQKTIYNKHQNTIDMQDYQAVSCV